jgi:glutathione S-transferase
MKLYLNKTSPYARLALVVAHEKGLAEKIELAWVDPWTSPAEFLAVAPLGRVPLLVTDTGEAIADSACICDYLDAAGKGATLLPPLPERAGVLQKYGLGRGIIELAFGTTIEKRFHEGEKQTLGERWMATLRRTAEHLEKDSQMLGGGEPDLGDLCLTVGLSYTEFRLPQIRWRPASPTLSAWLDRMSARPAMRATAPE